MTDYYFAVRSWNHSDELSEVSDEVKATTIANKAPVFTYKTTGDIIVQFGEEVKIEIKTSDPEGLPIKYIYERGSAAETASYNELSQTLVLSLKGNKAPVGYYSMKLLAIDPYGEQGEFELKYTIDSPPVDIDSYIVKLYPNPVNVLLTVETNAPTIDNVFVYNSNGAKMAVFIDKVNSKIDMSSLMSGVYSVDVVLKGKSYISRIIFSNGIKLRLKLLLSNKSL